MIQVCLLQNDAGVIGVIGITVPPSRAGPTTAFGRGSRVTKICAASMGIAVQSDCSVQMGSLSPD